MEDIHHHELVPEHRIVDQEELEALLEEYSIRKTDLPLIRQSDPALPAQANVGDVIKIIRDSRTTETAVFYRLVVE
jgi:DNA-directed RNA polymerase subunit H